MAISRRAARDQQVVEVTFSLRAQPFDGRRISVVGDFNDWNPSVNPLVERDGRLSVTVAVLRGRRYHYRFLTDVGQWVVDGDAEEYRPNEFGGPDCVLDTTVTATQ